MTIENKLQMLETVARFHSQAKPNSQMANAYQNVTLNLINNIFATEGILEELRDALPAEIVQHQPEPGVDQVEDTIKETIGVNETIKA